MPLALAMVIYFFHMIFFL